LLNSWVAGEDLNKTFQRIRGSTVSLVKHLLHYTGTSVRQAKKLKASFIVTFHSVSPDDRIKFEKTIRFLSQNFEIVGLEELLDQIQGRASIQKDRLVAITFDDGFRNHAEVVYPILERLRVPAAFYICPELVDRASLIWTWEVHSNLERLSKPARQRFFDLAGVPENTQGIVNWMKTIPVRRREQIQKDIRNCVQDCKTAQLADDRFELMTWEQIQKLDPALITIGSHTLTHIDLPYAEPPQLEWELSRSKEHLQSHLNRKIEHFAYPNGSFTEEVLQTVQRYYRSAVTTRPGIVKRGDDVLSLHRVHAEFDLPRFSWALAAAARRGRGS